MAKSIQTDITFGSEESASTGPVECLGMTFPSHIARRNYFLNKLGEKLKDPAFRKIDGFPVAEDEDILSLSDPPYYTACPNPFLGDFMAQYGFKYSPKSDYHCEPLTADVSEGKTDPLYMAHAYHTKVPHKAIMRYILHYTKPDDIVFDGFCGTGMAGVAAQLCGNRKEVEELGYRVDNSGRVSTDGTPVTVFSALGSRRAILNDLSPAATFIAGNYGTPIDTVAFQRDGSRILDEIQEELGWMYETSHADGKAKGRINYTLWSDVLLCSECGKEIVFVHEALDTTTGSVREIFPCPHCGADSDKNKLDLVYESTLDSLMGKPVSLPKRIPVMINYTFNGEAFEKAPDHQDLAVLKRISALPLPKDVPYFELPDMQMRRVGRMKPARITHIHHFFLPRSAHAVAALWRKASSFPDRRNRNALLFFVEQAIAGHSLLNRYKPVMHGKYGGSQVNNGLSGVFYIASQIAECSPWYNLNGKLKRLIKVFQGYRPIQGKTIVTTQDLSGVVLQDNSIDYIFTDPPFGENIYYSDLNILVESWHRVRTAPAKEAIVDRVKGKTLLDYQRMMTECFVAYYRALKPGRWMTVEFHNSRNSVWNAIQEALQHAGFVVADVRSLDKQQGSFQQVVSGNTVKQDLIISAYKPNGGLEERFKNKAGTDEGAWEFVSTHLKQLPLFVSKNGRSETIAERQGYVLYDRMVAFHVQRGYPVPLSTAEFHAGLRQRFPEREGMYFLVNQVSEYDRKRLDVKDVEQYELFVSDEKSAIQWVRRQLSEKPVAYQDLQPIYMKEAQRVWEKHEQPLELLTILEQNFIEDLSGTWRVPDSQKESDLEQVRHRFLLKEFQQYLGSKGKLKVVRMEALRAGFKDCWQKKDYTSILQMAKRVPEAVIEEDQALLMYFDNASLLAGG
jgi:hypothetical protein